MGGFRFHNIFFTMVFFTLFVSRTKKPGALAIVRDLFSKFCFFIKGVTNSPTALLRELSKIDRFLANVSTPFLDGDDLTYVDCLLLPKLQHVRVAAKIYRGESLCQCLWLNE